MVDNGRGRNRERSSEKWRGRNRQGGSLSEKGKKSDRRERVEKEGVNY